MGKKRVHSKLAWGASLYLGSRTMNLCQPHVCCASLVSCCAEGSFFDDGVGIAGGL